ncbi:hypothetical protein [Megasphaera massiliensis]|uniref:hypothetical protein n=1 Tax=Megasphaera massiliensis TaxID=1232428 RepID=UPI0005CA3470|nr:hypothetical protein [Megasphaera massiliensis]
MTKNEQARLTTEFRAHCREALKAQATQRESGYNLKPLHVAIIKAAEARGYGYALVDMLAWKMDMSEIQSYINNLIAESEEYMGIKTGLRLTPWTEEEAEK